MIEMIYKKVRDHFFRIALFMLRNENDAEEIAQIVCIKYLIYKDKVEKPLKWCAKVTKNEVYRFCKMRRRENLIISESELERKISKSEEVENQRFSELRIHLSQVNKLLSSEDYEVYKLYLECGTKTSEYTRRTNTSYYSAGSRIHKMKKNLKSSYLLSIGYIASKEIVSYKTNENIVNFIRVFSKKIRDNDLKSMRKYFQHYDEQKFKPLDFVKPLDYDIRILKGDRYEIILPYLDSYDQI